MRAPAIDRPGLSRSSIEGGGNKVIPNQVLGDYTGNIQFWDSHTYFTSWELLSLSFYSLRLYLNASVKLCYVSSLLTECLPRQVFLFCKSQVETLWPYCSYRKAILSRVSSFRNKITYTQIKRIIENRDGVCLGFY